MVAIVYCKEFCFQILRYLYIKVYRNGENILLAIYKDRGCCPVCI